MSVVIIDYGSGNLRSAEKSFERAAREANVHLDILVSNKPEDVLKADRVVLPGVGAFGDCAAGLTEIDGMLSALEEAVLQTFWTCREAKFRFARCFFDIGRPLDQLIIGQRIDVCAGWQML